MLEVRRAADRFCTRTDWLTSWHSFSYGPWYDPDNLAFGPLTVLNHDVLAPGAGFDLHRHSGVDLVTYVVAGALQHRDSAGHAAVVNAGEVQVLRAGAGVTHSERNASSTEPVEYVQMWLRSNDPVTGYGDCLLRPDDDRLATLPAGDLRLVNGQQGDSLGLTGERALAYVLSGELLVGEEPVSAGDAVLTAAQDQVLSPRSTSQLLVWQLFEPPQVLAWKLPGELPRGTSPLP